MAAPPRSVGGQHPCLICGPPLVLDEERTLRLEHLTEVDRPALEALYGTLSRRDLQRRFFTSARPPSSFFDQWASVASRGGFDLGAFLDRNSHSTLAGEAGYALLADGDGELGIAVDPASRGWLGPWLLDLLLRHAAERGVPNIQALVLVDNKAMMALAARRRYAVLDHPDWGTVRLTMSTQGTTPSWPRPHPRPRILVESERPRWFAERELREAGFDVAICSGARVSTEYCPVLNGEPCPLVEGADAVIVALPPDDPRTDELITAQRVVHPATRLLAGFTSDLDGTQHRRSGSELLNDLDHLLPEDDSDQGSSLSP